MAQNCKCNDGTIRSRGVSPPADCSSSRTTGCEGCCDGGVLESGGSMRGVRVNNGTLRPTNTHLSRIYERVKYTQIKNINRNIYNL